MTMGRGDGEAQGLEHKKRRKIKSEGTILHVYIYIYIYVYLFICLFICLFVYLLYLLHLLYLFIYLFIVYLFIVYLFIYIILYYIILYHIILYYFILYYVILHYIIDDVDAIFSCMLGWQLRIQRPALAHHCGVRRPGDAHLRHWRLGRHGWIPGYQ